MHQICSLLYFVTFKLKNFWLGYADKLLFVMRLGICTKINAVY